MDFPTFLVLATLITGLVWLADIIFLKPKRMQRLALIEADSTSERAVLEDAAKEPYFIELCRSFFPIILIVLLIRSFVVEPFRIPSGSMMPTLLVGDFILVNKFSYGLRLPVLNSKVLSLGEPERGDIIVFRYPENPKIDYIKRVVGVPGDEVAYYNKVLYINGKVATQQPLGIYQTSGGGAIMNGSNLIQERLPGIEHQVLIMPYRPDTNFEYQVPEGQYFVMGDNRDNSRDSRFWGTVPEENLVGKAFFIWMNWDPKADKLIAWERLGMGIE